MSSNALGALATFAVKNICERDRQNSDRVVRDGSMATIQTDKTVCVQPCIQLLIGNR
jgi:hypothetical protein